MKRKAPQDCQRLAYLLARAQVPRHVAVPNLLARPKESAEAAKWLSHADRFDRTTWSKLDGQHGAEGFDSVPEPE
jgi:hypothetical protein